MNEPSIRVVVIDDNASERTAIVRALQRASYRVKHSAEPNEGLSAIAGDAPQVVVASVPNRKGTELLRQIRSADTSGQAYVIAILDPAFASGELSSLLAADAQDFIRRPIDEQELLARVGAPVRLRRWMRGSVRPAPMERPRASESSRAPEPSRAPEAFRVPEPSRVPEPFRVTEPSPVNDLRRLRAWKNMGRIVTDDLAQVVAQPIRAVEGWPKEFGRGLRGATVSMSLPAERVEVRIWIVADAVGFIWLATAIFSAPDTPEAKVQDALRELANTAAGSLKRAALPDNVLFTTGIPVNATAVPARGDDTRCWVISPEIGEGSIALLAEARARENVRLPVADLREGMVLVHDLRNDVGVLLAPAGTRLTTSSVERFAAALGSRFVVEVACAA